MIDQRLRDLETRWKASGSLEDEVAYQHARLQAGLISPARMNLAAWLGSRAARRLCPEDPGVYADLVWWEDREHEKAAAYLADFGAVALTRVLLASCWARPKTHRLTKEGPRRRALYRVEQALVETGEGHLEDLRRYLDRVRPEPQPMQLGRAWTRYRESFPNMVVEFSVDPNPQRLKAAWAAKGLDQGTHLEAKADVVPWAMGYGDPLLERVRSRSKKRPLSS